MFHSKKKKDLVTGYVYLHKFLKSSLNFGSIVNSTFTWTLNINGPIMITSFE